MMLPGNSFIGHITAELRLIPIQAAGYLATPRSQQQSIVTSPTLSITICFGTERCVILTDGAHYKLPTRHKDAHCACDHPRHVIQTWIRAKREQYLACRGGVSSSCLISLMCKSNLGIKPFYSLNLSQIWIEYQIFTCLSLVFVAIKSEVCTSCGQSSGGSPIVSVTITRFLVFEFSREQLLNTFLI